MGKTQNNIESKNYKFKFSIVSAVYNVEPYVAETIESIINQDIGFEKNIQIILVNDGSKDKSGEICDEYAKKYPNNIKVIHKENGGVSSARNAGFEHIEGKYFNFIDPDDKFSKETLRNVWNFFEKHEDEVDLVTIPLYWFEAFSGPHYYNDKFNKGTRVIDLQKEWDSPLFYCNASFYHSRVKDVARYDTRLAISEDVTYVSTILLQKLKMGVVAEARYWYRRRATNTSALNTSRKKEVWYFNILNHFMLHIMDLSKEMYGGVPRYIQNVIFSDLRWKLHQDLNENIYYHDDPKTYKKYKKLLYSIYKRIHHVVILNNKHHTSLLKYHILKNVIRSKEAKLDTNRGNECFKIYGRKVMDVSACSFVDLHFLKIDNTSLKMDFSVALLPEVEDYDVYIKINNNEYKKVKKTGKVDSFFKLDDPFYKKVYYKLNLPLTNEPIYFSLYLKSSRTKKFIPLTSYNYCKHFPLNDLKESYYTKNNYCCKVVNKNTFVVKRKKSFLAKLVQELKYDKSLIKLKNTSGLKLIFIRWYYKLYKTFHKKQEWLITDRINKAGDNGEAFFRYLENKKPKDINYCYAISKCKDYDDLKKEFKNVIELKTKKFYLKYLLCDKNISSQADDFITIPLGVKQWYLKDIINDKDFIFLQHGIALNDLSGWLNRYTKNITGLIASAKPEYDIFCEPQFCYKKENIWLTGLARYDRLYNNDQKIITIMPTWRKYLFNVLDNSTGIWSIYPGFTNSKYYNFYNDLINDKTLIETAKQYGYKINLMLHPIVAPYANLFKPNEYVTIADITTPYKDVFAQSSLVVTDYSSAVYDFAYLKKPVVYCQFDRKEMMENEKSYELNTKYYDKEALGDVCLKYEDLISTIINYIKNDCKMKDKYIKRVETFYKYTDKKNCERIFNKIINLK